MKPGFPGARIRTNLKTAKSFYAVGVTLGSLLLYPIRRRLPSPRNMIRLKGGLTVVTPVDAELTALFHEIWVDRCYVPEPLTLEPHDTIVEIGAHMGVFTLWAAAQYPGIRVVSLEPCPESFAILQQNISRNRLKSVELLQSACGGHSGPAILVSRGPNSMHTLYDRDLLLSTFRSLGPVRMLSLDDLFNQLGIGRCGLLKLDSEGAEYEILLNASDATLHRIRNIAMEYHVGLNDHTPDELADFLSDKGFAVKVQPMRSTEDGYLYAELR